ncbi:MAG: hypothetical protein JW717_10115 [Marinilabiliaceae bacterium]|nr:hypothetical protein [Marinilabiliaceae bacterium]
MRYNFLIFFFTISLVSFSQVNFDYQYLYPEFNRDHSEQLYLNIENHSFLRNNEFFGSYIEGYTLAGYDFKPSLFYYFNSKVRLQTGIHFKKYHGQSYDSDPNFFVTIHAVLVDSFHIIIGTLKGSVEHQMPEPLYDNELLFTDPQENGIQLLYNNNWMYGDLWIDWQQFIERGDTIPEILTFGLSTKFNLLSFGNSSKLILPFQTTIFHRGGQISNFDEPMLSLNNGASGLIFENRYETAFIRKTTVNAYFLWYHEMTNAWKHFKDGWALYPSVSVENTSVQLMAGYFHGHNYASPKGSYLFQSVSNFNDSVYSLKRDLIIAKLAYNTKLAKYVNFAVTIEGYYDVTISQFDYSYGVSIFANPRFFLSKLK